jgi:hypothetical protein
MWDEAYSGCKKVCFMRLAKGGWGVYCVARIHTRDLDVNMRKVQARQSCCLMGTQCRQTNLIYGGRMSGTVLPTPSNKF